MVRNGYGAKYIWYEMVSGYGTKLQFCGTKWLWCKIHMERNCNFVVRNGKLWYEMVMVQNSYGTKWFLAMVRNCNFVVRNGKLWYEMAMVRNGYGTK
jgi:ribosomal protein L36